MSAPASGPFWRAAGMSYLKYANICADMMRGVLKEPFKSKAMQRQSIYFRSSKFVDGKQTPPGEGLLGAGEGGRRRARRRRRRRRAWREQVLPESPGRRRVAACRGRSVTAAAPRCPLPSPPVITELDAGPTTQPKS
jgi:F-type H+-transporting ATPase subunit epsilon